MENKEYIISIVGTQIYEDDTGEVKVDTVGSYYEENGVKYISYKEYEDGNSTISTMAYLKIEQEHTVTLSKENSVTALVLQKGKRNICTYDTGYGQLSMGVYTSELKNELTDLGGKLSIDYTLDIGSNLASRNKLQIEVKQMS